MNIVCSEDFSPHHPEATTEVVTTNLDTWGCPVRSSELGSTCHV